MKTNKILSFVVLSGIFLNVNVHAGSASAKLSALADSLIAGYSAKTSTSKVTLAVFPLNCEGKLKEQRVGFAASEVMSHRFIANPGFAVVERGELSKLFSEQKLHASGAVDNEKSVRLGKILGAGVILVGNIQKVGDKYQVNARLVSVETSEVIASGYEELDSKIFEEDAGRYLMLVPEKQTLGVYAVYNYRKNPNKVAAVDESLEGLVTITRNPHSFSSRLAGGGLLYRPTKNIQINVESTSSIEEVEYSKVFWGTYQTSRVRTTTMSFMGSYVSGFSRKWGYLVGLGAQKINFAIANFGNGKENPPIGMFVKTGIEFKPQARIGFGVNLRYDLPKVVLKSMYNNKILELNPLSLESTVTLYF